MSNKDKRKFKRHDTFVQLIFCTPNFNNKLEISCWVKDVSQDGVAIELCILSPDEIHAILEIVDDRPVVDAIISIPDYIFSGGECEVGAKCKIVWGKFSRNRNFYNIGLQILNIEPKERPEWNFFVEKLSQ